MMNTTYELNNLRKDADYLNRDMRATSIVSVVFSAMVRVRMSAQLRVLTKLLIILRNLVFVQKTAILRLLLN